jgi:hypothetical protein
MNELLMPADSIKYTSQGDYACSWCGYVIPVNSRHELQEWCSADVAGMFCSKSHAIAATNNLNYQAKFSFNKEVI